MARQTLNRAEKVKAMKSSERCNKYGTIYHEAINCRLPQCDHVDAKNIRSVNTHISSPNGCHRKQIDNRGQRKLPTQNLYLCWLTDEGTALYAWYSSCSGCAVLVEIRNRKNHETRCKSNGKVEMLREPEPVYMENYLKLKEFDDKYLKGTFVQEVIGYIQQEVVTKKICDKLIVNEMADIVDIDRFPKLYAMVSNDGVEGYSGYTMLKLS